MPNAWPRKISLATEEKETSRNSSKILICDLNVPAIIGAGGSKLTGLYRTLCMGRE